MAATAVAESNRPVFGEKQLLAEYNKLIKLRDDVFAEQGIQMQVSKSSLEQGNLSSATQHLPATTASQAPNGSHKPIQINSIAPTSLHGPKVPSNSFQSTSPNVQKLPVPSPASSGLDPIFLEKSDVLVRAELEQKRQRTERAELEEKKHNAERERQSERHRIQQQRQRLERVLEEQNLQKERQMAWSQDTLPDFDATEVLKRSQELVKPNKLHESRRADGTASSSDSFDENTFYSSQMDESTTTEEADESRKADEPRKADESRKIRPHQICNFFRRGVPCKFGDTCKFSHDPAFKQKLGADGSQAIDLDTVNADEQTSPRHDDPPRQHDLANGSKARPPASMNLNSLPTSFSEKERLLQERVAQLEAELRNSKADKQGGLDLPGRGDAKAQRDSQEESAYSPPPPDEFGRDAGLRALVQQQPPLYAQPVREYGRRSGYPPSPIPNNMRIVQNNLPSPVAPQPQRVSPLAVAKAAQVARFQQSEGDARRAFDRRTSDVGVGSARQTPNVVQLLSSKKRRRGLDSGQETRNVVPRRGNDSPAVRIKAEAISPPPFTSITSIREVRQSQEQPRQPYVGTAGSQHRDLEVFHQPRVVERPTSGQILDDRRPMTPLTRRVVSRNGQQYIANGEPDLRRVVSARQVRAPLSPAPYPVQYSAPQARATRAASQVYISPSGQGVPQQYKASVQPQQTTYVNGRSPSPVRRMPQSPVGRHSIMMAPPPRRIVVDQYGNQFEELPAPRDRQVSVIPMQREGDYDPRYAQVVPRTANVRHPRYIDGDEEGQYVRRVPSPTSPTYVEYPQPTRARQVIGPRGELYEDDPYTIRSDGPRVMQYSDARPPARYAESQAPAPHYEEVHSAREGTVRMQSVGPTERHYEGPPPPQEEMVRMQSVRPVERHYEVSQERIQRVQSVRPQPRIVSLGEKPESGPQIVRQVSVRPESGAGRQIEYVPNDRQRYQYASQRQEGGYIEAMQEESGLHEGQVTGARRVMQQRL